MKKKLIVMVAFAALIAVGLGVVETSLSALGCRCFDEDEAFLFCEDLCQFYTGTGCEDVIPTSISGCAYDECVYVFWSYCENGSRYRRDINFAECPDCIN
jgi:hypothetical protein